MKILSRYDVEQSTSRASGETTLRYVRHRGPWLNTLPGQLDGVFFAASAAEVPLPESLAPLAIEAGVSLDVHIDVPKLKALMVEWIVADAWTRAPQMICDITGEEMCWLPADLYSLESQRMKKMNAVDDHLHFIVRDLRRRILSRSIGQLPAVVVPAPAAVVSLATVQRAAEATKSAREAELPQRLPSGARRKLERMQAGVYVSVGDRLDRQSSLAVAMTKTSDAVIDWDGEWPVVVRRYEAGRVVYRVEDALRRVADSDEETAA